MVEFIDRYDRFAKFMASNGFYVVGNDHFTVNGYYNMFRGMRDSQRKVNLDKIPKDLPILVVSGQNDPVGEFGKGPEIVAETYRKTGIQDVTLKLFPDDRHEILNELDKEVVDQYLLNWIETRM